MSFVKRIPTMAMLAMVFLLGFASTMALRKARDTQLTETRSGAGGTATRNTAEGTGNGRDVRYDEDMIRWIPLVVPSFALVLVVGIYLIYAAVL